MDLPTKRQLFDNDATGPGFGILGPPVINLVCRKSKCAFVRAQGQCCLVRSGGFNRALALRTKHWGYQLPDLYRHMREVGQFEFCRFTGDEGRPAEWPTVLTRTMRVLRPLGKEYLCWKMTSSRQ
eukprot:SAG22_NODE_728_length_7596_cov_342.279178_4_plen_125_part_00